MRHRIAYLKGSIDNPSLSEHDQKIMQPILQRLLDNDFASGLGLERLSCTNIYAIRVDLATRILFTKVTINKKSYLLPLELIENHDYQKSRFLQKGVLKKFLQNWMPTLIELNEINAESFTPIDDHEQESLMHDLLEDEAYAGSPTPMLYYGDSVICLNADQEHTAVSVTLPAIVTGGPGAGKSCAALYALWHQWLNYKHDIDDPSSAILPFMYICESEILCHKMEEDWDNNFAPQSTDSNPKPAVIFSTYEGLIKKYFSKDLPIMPNEKLADEATKIFSTETDFMVWWTSTYQPELYIKAKAMSKIKVSFADATIMNISAEEIYEEFRICCGYHLDPDHQNLPLEYKMLGNNQSICTSEEQKIALWNAFKAYKHFLQINNKTDLAFFEPYQTITPQIGFTVIDEIQDLSLNNIDIVIQLTAYRGNKRQIFAAGDSHQNVSDALSSLNLIEQIFRKYNHDIQPDHINLPGSYRCSKAIIDTANRWLGLQYYLCGGLTDKKQYVELVSAMDSVPGSTRTIDYADIHRTTELSELAESAHVALICFKENLESDDFQRDFKAFKIRLTPQGAKGCEYSTVIAINPFSGLEKINKLLEGIIPVKPTNAHLPKNQEKHRSIKILIRRFNSILVTLTRAKNNLIIVQKDLHQYANLFTWLNLPLTSDVTATATATPITENASSKADWLLEAKKLLRKGQEESAKRIYIDELGHTEEAFAEFKRLALPKITLTLNPTPAAVLPSLPAEATPSTPDVLSSTQTPTTAVIKSLASGDTPIKPNPMRLLFTAHQSKQRPTQPAPMSIPTKTINAPDLTRHASSSFKNQLSSKPQTKLKIDAQTKQKKWEIIPKLLEQTLHGVSCDEFLERFFYDTMLNLPDNFLLSCFSELAPSLITQEMVATLGNWIVSNQNALFTPVNIGFLINQIAQITNQRVKLLFELVFHKFILVSDGLAIALKQAIFQKWVILNIQKPPEPDQSHILLSALVSTKWDEFLVYINKNTSLSIPNEVFTLKYTATSQYDGETTFTVLLIKLQKVYQVPLDQLTESQKESVKICMRFLNQIINEKKNHPFIQKQLNESPRLNQPSWLYSLTTQINPSITCYLLGSLLKAKIVISPKLWFDTHPQHHPLMITLTTTPDGISFLKQMLVVHPEYAEALFRKEDFFAPAFINKKSASAFQSIALFEHGESLLLRILIFHPATLLFNIDKKEHFKKLFRDTALISNTIVKPGMNFLTALLTRGLQQHAINYSLTFLIALIKKHPELIMALQIDAWAISKQGELTYLWDELIKSDMEHAKILLDTLIHTSNEKQALIPEAQLIGIAESIFHHSAVLPETTIHYNCMLIKNMIERYPHINWPEIISKATHHTSIGQHYLENLLSSRKGKVIFPAMLRVDLATLNPQQSIYTQLFGDEQTPDKPGLFNIYWSQADMQENSFQILYEWWLNIHSSFPSNNVANAIIQLIEQIDDEALKISKQNLFYKLFTMKVSECIQHPSYSMWLHQKLSDKRSSEASPILKNAMEISLLLATLEKPQQFIQLAKISFDKRPMEISLNYWFMKNNHGHYCFAQLLDILEKHTTEEEMKYVHQIYTLVIEQIIHISPTHPHIFIMLETLIEAQFMRSNKRIQIRPNCDIFIFLIEAAPHLFNCTNHFWLNKDRHGHAPLWYFLHHNTPETSAFLTKLYHHPHLEGLLTDPRYKMMQQLEVLTSNNASVPSLSRSM